MRNAVVSDLKSIKSAALYYDYVIPAFPLMDVNDEVVRDVDSFLTGRGNLEIDLRENAGKLIFRYSKVDVEYEEALKLVPIGIRSDLKSIYGFQLISLISLLLAQENQSEVDSDRFRTGLQGMEISEEEEKKLFNKIGLLRLPLWRSSELYYAENDSDIALQSDDPLVSLEKIRLIDERLLSWEHLVEIRSDDVAKQKLRGFRIFFRDEFKGKSLSEIEDKLLRKIDEYNDEARKQNLSLVDATLDAVSGSDGIIAALGGNLMVAGSYAVGAGVCVLEIGNIAIKIARSKSDRREGLFRHDVAYLAHLKKATNS